MLLGPSRDAGKRRKPKNNIAKSNSSFISRCIVHENMAKRVNEHPVEGYFAFANINRAFQWLDLSSPQMVGTNPLDGDSTASLNMNRQTT